MTDHRPKISNYFEELSKTLNTLDSEPIQKSIDTLHKARLEGKRIFMMGNGGSASTASHLVLDLAKNTRVPHLKPFKVIGLSDNMAAITAFANDEGYENVFAQQLANLVEEGDVVLGISTSGNSPNVLRGVEMANERGALTIGMTGFDAGKLGSMVELHLHVPSDCIERVEDIHLALGHLMIKVLRELASES